MKLKQYQETAIKELVYSVFKQLDIDGVRRKIVFKAPTGAGKTVMITETMCRVHETIADSDCQYNRVAYIWIAPNALHIQSYKGMKNAFTDTKRLSPIVYDEIELSEDSYIKPGEVFFVNWQSINKTKNVMVRGSEQACSIYDVIRRTSEEHNIPIVCIIDEEHMFAGENAKKSEKVLSQINPKVEVRISATPKTTDYDDLVKVDRSQVINEGMIKMGISLNPAVRGDKTEEALNIYLLGEALKKRKQLADAYKQLGININPLLLIQLPNDNVEALTQDEVALKDSLLQVLDVMHQSSVENGKVAVWLSGERKNLEGIEKNDSLVDVLIFKQAIAMGWDCPRAAVLLIYRKLSSESFTIQTVGRIMRMPQQRFYNNPILNMGYVYTDLSADVIKIEADSIDYISMQQAVRRDGLTNITLKSYKEERSNKENNVLRADFKKVLFDYFVNEWTLQKQGSLVFSWDDDGNANVSPQSKIEENRRVASNHIILNITSVQVDIPTDMNIIDEEGVIQTQNKTGFARTPFELKKIFERFCSQMLNGWSKSQCANHLENGLLEAMEQLFEIFETDAYKVICSKQNMPKFADIVGRALAYYKKEVMPKKLKANRGFIPFFWSLPELRTYKDSVYQGKLDVKNHALLPYYELNRVSSPEQKFTKFLEENSENIDWWYKNGDNGSEHFAVKYENSQKKNALFFVDYIVRMKDGRIFLFDTKSENSDSEAPYKHNGLIDYMEEDDNKDLNLKGGVIIEHNMNWMYSSYRIENTTDLTGWDSFHPDLV
ncbi:MAG: DEAD/DEAH box helicase family protein [Paludibacteraceae bacterium]|nr:DEAD/DEAH box helicase family protein [Paludibacteraceae bacterium]